LHCQISIKLFPCHASIVQIKLPFPCTNEDYEERMSGAIAAAKAANIDAIAYGDLFLADVSHSTSASSSSCCCCICSFVHEQSGSQRPGHAITDVLGFHDRAAV
jgi:hypothetical protein